MKKQIHKLFKHGFLVFLALMACLIVITPISVLSNDVIIVKNVSNSTNKNNMDEDFRLFCLATLPEKDYADELAITKEYQDYNYEISPQSS